MSVLRSAFCKVGKLFVLLCMYTILCICIDDNVSLCFQVFVWKTNFDKDIIRRDKNVKSKSSVESTTEEKDTLTYSSTREVLDTQQTQVERVSKLVRPF